jgi:hypothetical protein
MPEFDANNILLDHLLKTRHSAPRHLVYVNETASIRYTMDYMYHHKLTCCGVVGPHHVRGSETIVTVDDKNFLGISLCG